MRVAAIFGKMLWTLALVGAGLGGANFILTYASAALFRANPDISAPQLAALAAESLAYAILPYVLARAWDELTRPLPASGTQRAPQHSAGGLRF